MVSRCITSEEVWGAGNQLFFSDYSIPGIVCTLKALFYWHDTHFERKLKEVKWHLQAMSMHSTAPRQSGLPSWQKADLSHRQPRELGLLSRLCGQVVG